MTRAIIHPHPRSPGLPNAPRTRKNDAKDKEEPRPLYDGLLARSFAKGIVDRFRDGGYKAAIAGSLRRGHTQVHDIDILAGYQGGILTKDGFRWDDGRGVDLSGLDLLHSSPQKISFRSPVGIVAEVRIVPVESWGSALQYYTGSRYHNIWLRSLAKRAGLSLSEYGFYELEKDPVTNMVTRGPLIPIAEESEVYKVLKLRWLPPKYRDKPNGHPGRYIP